MSDLNVVLPEAPEPPTLRRRILTWAGRSLVLSVISGLSYLAVFYVTFPDDAVKTKIMTEARKKQIDLRIGDIHPAGFDGLTLEGVSIASIEEPKANKKSRVRGRARLARGSVDDDGGAEETPTPVPEPATPAPAKSPFLNADRVTAHVDMLPLLRSGEDRTLSLDLDADLYGGNTEGTITLAKETTGINLIGKEMDLAKYPFEGESFQLQTEGFLAFATDLTLHKKNYRESVGSVNAGIQAFKITKGSKVKGMDLPSDLIFTESVLNLEVAEGKAKVTELKLVGEELTVEGDGQIYLQSDLSRARLNLKIRFKLGKSLEQYALFIPSTAKSDDGWYHYIISGKLTDPRARPDRASARRGGKGRTSSSSSLPDEDSGDVPSGMMDRIGRPMPGIGSMPDTSASSDDGDTDRRREDRRRLAEERRARREERLKRLREARERRGDEGGEMAGPIDPMDNAPFRPQVGMDFPPAPPGAEEIVRGNSRGQNEDQPMEIPDDFPPREQPEEINNEENAVPIMEE